MLKRTLKTTIVLMLTLALVGTGSLLWQGTPEIASAANDEHSIDFSKFETTWNETDFVVDGEQIDLIEEANDFFDIRSAYAYDEEHGTELKKKDLKLVSTSYNSKDPSKSLRFDFSKSFSFRGTIQTSKSPDGMVILFHNDKDYTYKNDEGGSNLCAYNVQARDTYVRNALAVEFDTYDSANVSVDASSGEYEETFRTDQFTDKDKERLGGEAPYAPHISISTVDGKGKDTPYAFTRMGTGEGSFTISWTVTSASPLRGTYSVSYETSNHRSTLTSYGLDPVNIMGADEAYMAIAGSFNFRESTNPSVEYEPAKDWYIQLTDFSYATPTETETALSAKVTEDGKTPDSLWSYSFDLKDDTGKVIQTKTNKGQNISFDKIEYTKEGTYNYTISQRKGSEPGVTYDASVYDVEVNVAREADALKVDKITYRKAGTETEAVFANRTEPARLVVTEESTQKAQYAEAGDNYTYTVTFRNEGKGTAYGVFVRRYMPKYTHAVSVTAPGEYGYVNEKEHASAFFESIAPGQSVTLKFKLRVDECKPDNLRLKKEVLYQILGSKKAPKLNGTTDPGQKLE